MFNLNKLICMRNFYKGILFYFIFQLAFQFSIDILNIFSIFIFRKFIVLYFITTFTYLGFIIFFIKKVNSVFEINIADKYVTNIIASLILLVLLNSVSHLFLNRSYSFLSDFEGNRLFYYEAFKGWMFTLFNIFVAIFIMRKYKNISI